MNPHIMNATTNQGFKGQRENMANSDPSGSGGSAIGASGPSGPSASRKSMESQIKSGFGSANNYQSKLI